MKTLYLLRHAKAEPARDKEEDKDRPLSEYGRESCKTIGAYMHAKGYQPDLALCSPAVRTRETFDRVRKAAGIHPDCQFDKGIYAASADQIINRLRSLPDDIKSILIVGHNPAMHMLAVILALPAHNALHKAIRLKYPPGSLAVLGFECDSWEDVAPETAELMDFMTLSTF